MLITVKKMREKKVPICNISLLSVTNCTFGYTYSRETAKHTALQAIQKEFSLFGRS